MGYTNWLYNLGRSQLGMFFALLLLLNALPLDQQDNRQLQSANHVEKLVIPGGSEFQRIQQAVTLASNMFQTDLQVEQNFTDCFGILHIYTHPILNDLPVFNKNVDIHVKENEIIALHGQVMHLKVRSNQTLLPQEECIKKAEAHIRMKRDTFVPVRGYFDLQGLVPALMFQVRSKSDWLQVIVDMTNGKILQKVSYQRKFSYQVVPLPKMSPLQGFGTVDHYEMNASPLGWHQDFRNYTDTRGNNVQLHIPTGQGQFRPDGGPLLDFKTQWDPKALPTDPKNQDAAALQLWYILNYMHDLTYQYGFDEAAGNFQNNDFGKGGKGNDALIAICQGEKEKNEATFSTPPDGQPPVLKMYLFENDDSSKRDGSLDSSIAIHEYMHGVTTRMTGGSKNAKCLNSFQGRSLSEGWADAMSIFLSYSSNSTRASSVGVGTFAMGEPNGPGVRKYRYSTDYKIDPRTYKQSLEMHEVHDAGAVWATMLNELYWNMVDKYGFSQDWMNASQTKGNIMTIRLIFSALTLQPCEPSFGQARDAILLADQKLYGGQNQCEIWKAFAKRGLGYGLLPDITADWNDLPPSCK